jgi:hypothetical protein
MSNFDSPEDKKTGKHLTATQQLRNLLNGLLDEEGCPQKDGMAKEQRAGLEEMRRELNESRVGEMQAKFLLQELRESVAEG